MNKKNKEFIEKYKRWFKETVISSHIKNTQKAASLKEFQINPLLLTYLAKYLAGNSSPESLAKALIYPRVLGTSITTTFGTAIQNFVTTTLDGHGSLVSGIDIEFTDHVDGRRKYCQLKAGPNSLNRGDVKPMKDHFKSARNLAKTNNNKLLPEDFVLCILYGEVSEKNSFIKELEQDHPVYIGKDFWHRLTGEKNFYEALIKSSEEIADEVDMKKIIDDAVAKLAIEIKKKNNSKK